MGEYFALLGISVTSDYTQVPWAFMRSLLRTDCYTFHFAV